MMLTLFEKVISREVDRAQRGPGQGAEVDEEHPVSRLAPLGDVKQQEPGRILGCASIYNSELLIRLSCGLFGKHYCLHFPSST